MKTKPFRIKPIPPRRPTDHPSREHAQKPSSDDQMPRYNTNCFFPQKNAKIDQKCGDERTIGSRNPKDRLTYDRKRRSWMPDRAGTLQGRRSGGRRREASSLSWACARVPIAIARVTSGSGDGGGGGRKSSVRSESSSLSLSLPLFICDVQNVLTTHYMHG